MGRGDSRRRRRLSSQSLRRAGERFTGRGQLQEQLVFRFIECRRTPALQFLERELDLHHALRIFGSLHDGLTAFVAARRQIVRQRSQPFADAQREPAFIVVEGVKVPIAAQARGRVEEPLDEPSHEGIHGRA